MVILKSRIFECLREIESMKHLTDEELDGRIFYSPSSLRLTLQGFAVIRKIFIAYSFAMPKSTKSKHLMSLSKLDYPYFLSPKRLIVFSEMDASMITLQGGVESFLENLHSID